MQISTIHRLLLFLMAFGCLVSTANAQSFEYFEDYDQLNLTAGSSSSMSVPLNGIGLRKKLDKGYFKASLDLGEDFMFANENFEVEVVFTLEAFQGGTPVTTIFDPAGYTLQINQLQPEAYLVMDLKDHINTVDGNDDLIFDEIVATITSTSNTNADLNPYGRLRFGYEIDFGMDVAPVASTITEIAFNTANARTATFTWTDDPSISHYQLELIRLYNTNELYLSESLIQTNVNWNKAITIDIDLKDPSVKSYDLNIAEGTGFYVARVRPIGHYYAGGRGNAQNWGQWSDSQTGNMELDQATINLPFFYFEDSEENVNWIYSRVYTENSRVKENISYADGMLRVKQQQTYLPSKNITLIQQTVYDRVGRPAVSSIPVPVPGKQSNYREKFMTAAGTSEPYQAKHFDEDANIKNPELVDETGDFGYYKDNADKGVPNAEGFGYTRTIYYNDGSGRVQEQSGVGKTHSVDETVGGRTTRYLYATPSDDELIAIFGDEAPTSESVLKTITIDPNNTSTVTYTSKEGNVIATAMVFSDADNNLIDLDNETNFVATVDDKITANLKKEGGFVSSKKVSLALQTDIEVGYSVRCEILPDLCSQAEIDCNYQVQIEIMEVNERGNVVSTTPVYATPQDLSSVTCTDIGNGDGDYKVIAPVVITLDPGNYVIVKKLTPQNVEFNISSNKESLENQTVPLTDLVAGWLNSIEDAAQVRDFNRSLYELAQAVNNGTLPSFTNPSFPDFPVAAWPQEFIDTYNAVYPDVAKRYQITFAPFDYDPYVAGAGDPSLFVLKTPCCEFSVPVQWLPPFDHTPGQKDINGDPIDGGGGTLIGQSDENSDGYLQPVNYYDVYQTPGLDAEYFPDFEGYMLAFMADCHGPGKAYATEAELKDAIYRQNGYMDGWEIEGTFNLMIYHMLTDTYDQDGGAVDNPVVGYNADALLSCWTGILSQLKEELCLQEFDLSEGIGNTNISAEFDAQNGGDGDVHDDHFDDNFKGGFFILKWILKRKVSKRMRDKQTGGGEGDPITAEVGQFHVVREFLNCSGSRFAKIITPLDAQPLAEDQDGTFSYDEPSIVPPVDVQLRYQTIDNYFGATQVIDASRDYKYIPLSDWDPKMKDEGVYTDESLFPSIKNPIYAFKYFEYHGEGDPNYQAIEQSVCFNDPNDCWQTYTTADGTFINKTAPKVACCSPNPSYNEPGCFADTEYPGLNPSMVGFGSDYDGNDAKYVVEEFCGKGRIRCPFTHEEWSAGQRFSFYKMVKNLKNPGEAPQNDLAEYNLACLDIETADEWYAYTGTLADQATYGCPDIINGTNLGSTDAACQSNYTQLSLNDGSTNFYYYQLEIEGLVDGCVSGCESRRDEFRAALLDMLEAKCYEIGGCRTDDPSTWNVIPEEDIDVIVDQIVQNCQSQCQITTYSCETSSCRPMTMTALEIGAPTTSFSLDYGTGGYDNPEFCDGTTTYTYDDLTACVTAPDGSGNFKKCDLINDNRQKVNLSWYEYTLVQQARDWDFEIELPSYCVGEEGTTTFACCDAPENSAQGTTFLPKDQYELSKDRPADALNPNDQVFSPAKGINVHVDPEGN